MTLSPSTHDELHPFHPIANHWPLLEGDELQKLVDDIKEHGVVNPIWRDREGRIIDGRNRWLAAQRAGVECPSRTYDCEDGAALVRFVLSQNERRRHLPIDQRAAIAAELAGYGQGGDRSKVSPDTLTQEQAAEAMGVSRPSVARAAALKKDAPDLHEKVKAGAMRAGAARKSAAERKGIEVRRPLSDDVTHYRAPARNKSLIKAEHIALRKKTMRFALDVGTVAQADVHPDQIDRLEPKEAEMFWHHLRTHLAKAKARLDAFAERTDATVQRVAVGPIANEVTDAVRPRVEEARFDTPSSEASLGVTAGSTFP